VNSVENLTVMSELKDWRYNETHINDSIGVKEKV
jgi:hypothetical protein